MKNTIVLMLALALGTFSCKKELESPPEVSDSIYETLAKEAEDFNLNEYGNLLLENLREADYEFSVIQTRNLGVRTQDVAGGFVPNIQLTNIAGIDVLSNDNNGNYMQFDNSGYFDNLFGASINGYFQASPNVNFSFYVPEPIICQRLGSGSSLNLSRSESNILEWNADPNNPLEKVIIQYKLYSDDPMIPSSLYLVNYIAVDDSDASFDITSVIDNQTKGIIIILTRGNGQSVTLASGENIFVNIRSEDHHVYLID